MCLSYTTQFRRGWGLCGRYSQYYCSGVAWVGGKGKQLGRRASLRKLGRRTLFHEIIRKRGRENAVDW